jgi:hypothetical protein
VNTLLAAKTNWGKSWFAQATTEQNAPEYDRVVLADYKSEYAGLVEYGLCQQYPVDQRDIGVSAAAWQSLIERNDGVRLDRGGVGDGDWREIMESVAIAARQSADSVLILIDEAHFVAPQRHGYPDAIKALATTGDAEGVSVLWVTQRPGELDETVIAQAQATLLGGFTSDNDLGKIGRVVEYPAAVHNPQAGRVSGLPESLQRGGEPVPLERFEDDDGKTVGSEWVHSEGGAFERLDSRETAMSSTHYAPERNRVSIA